MTELLELQFKLACDRDHAFQTFTEKVDLWWPKGYRRSPESSMQFEPGSTGRLIERSSVGQRAIAEIVAWEPPDRLTLNWWLGVERHPTRVDIQFADASVGTEITIRHTPGLAAEDGIWPTRAPRFEAGWTKTMTELDAFIANQKIIG